MSHATYVTWCGSKAWISPDMILNFGMSTGVGPSAHRQRQLRLTSISYCSSPKSVRVASSTGGVNATDPKPPSDLDNLYVFCAHPIVPAKLNFVYRPFPAELL